jgi:hypothetical protein
VAGEVAAIAAEVGGEEFVFGTEGPRFHAQAGFVRIVTSDDGSASVPSFSAG